MIPGRVPNAGNNYLVSFMDWSEVNTGGADACPWFNPLSPYLRQAINPFIPGDCGRLTELFKNCTSHEILCLPAFCESLVVMDLNHLMNFSLVSKCCYIATKSNLVWQGKINFLLSNVHCMPQFKCRFVPEQQFQVVFKELQNRKAPFQLQYDHDKEKCREEQETHNKCQTWDDFNKERHPEVNKAYNECRMRLSSLEDEALKKGVFRVLFCKRLGENYDEAPGSVDLPLNAERCLTALDMIPNEYNHQIVFENVIQSSEAFFVQSGNNHQNVAQGNPYDDHHYDNYHLSITCKAFNDHLLIPSADQVQVALRAFGNIQSLEFKMKAFALILSNHQLPSGIAMSFYDALPLALQNAFKGEMYAVNGYSSVYEGHDHDVGFGDFMVADQIRSDVARKAAFNLYISLRGDRLN